MESKETTTDEVDLSQLFSKIGDFFKKAGLGIMRLLALIRRTPLQNKPLFIVIIIASMIVGFTYSKFIKKKFYESTLILNSGYLNKRLVDNIIDKLNLLADEKTKHGLAKVLNISDSLADNIVAFSAKPFIVEQEIVEVELLKEQLKNAQEKTKSGINVIDQVIKRIEIENRHAFEITIRTYNPTVIGPLQTSLVNFLKGSDFIKKRIEITQRNNLEKKIKLTRELQKLDSLKFIIYDNYKNMAAQSKQGSNNVILSDKSVTNPIEIYHQDLDLYNELQSINTSIYLQPDFEIVDGFAEFSEPASTSIKKILAISVLIGIAVAYSAVALSAFNKYLASLS